MLEESQNHRARVTPDSQEKHNYLAEVVGTPHFSKAMADQISRLKKPTYKPTYVREKTYQKLHGRRSTRQ